MIWSLIQVWTSFSIRVSWWDIYRSFFLSHLRPSAKALRWFWWTFQRWLCTRCPSCRWSLEFHNFHEFWVHHKDAEAAGSPIKLTGFGADSMWAQKSVTHRNSRTNFITENQRIDWLTSQIAKIKIFIFYLSKKIENTITYLAESNQIPTDNADTIWNDNDKEKKIIRKKYNLYVPKIARKSLCTRFTLKN